MYTRVVLRTALLFAAVLLLTGPASAENSTSINGTERPSAPAKAGRAGICQIGPGLGSTLLFPYVEVDLADTQGVSTLISVNNGLNSPTLVRVVMWTDWGIPTLAFDIYLKPFDVQTINVRSLLNGQIPSTGSGADLSGFPFCDFLPPFHTNPVLTPGEQEHLKTAHTGQPGHIDGQCYGADHRDNIFRGYITADVVDECSAVEAFDPIYTPANTSYPYFADGGHSDGIGIVDNRLWGDVVYVDFRNNSAQGSEAISLWADDLEFPGTDIYTFYGRHSGFDGRDERVPLAWRWDQRFFNGGPFAGGADLIVFHEPHSSAASPISCLDSPGWWPLESGVGSLDEEGENYQPYGTTHFGLVTQRVSVSTLSPSPPYDFGWIQIDTSEGQMWVQPSLTASGLYSAGFNGFPTNSLCAETPPTP